MLLTRVGTPVGSECCRERMVGFKISDNAYKGVRTGRIFSA